MFICFSKKFYVCLYVFVSNSLWLYPGQTDKVAVDILIPLGSQDTVNTLTLNIVGTEIPEKTVNILVQNAFSKVKIRKYNQSLQKCFSLQI